MITNKGELSYDYLVVGLGFEGETFGIEGLDKYAFGIKNVNDARESKLAFHTQFAKLKLFKRNRLRMILLLPLLLVEQDLQESNS